MAIVSGSPALSLSQQLAEQFYQWEIRGRGWHVYPTPVQTEPLFEPFLGHYGPQPSRTMDDGRRPTFFSQLIQDFSSLFGTKPKLVPPPIQPVPPRQPLESKPRDWVELSIHLPADAAPDIESFEQFLVSVSACYSAIGFEMVGTGAGVSCQLVVDKADLAHVESQFASYFPDAVLTIREQTLREGWKNCRPMATLVVDFGLSHEFMLPLACQEDLHTDPYVSLVAALSRIQAGETAVYQVLLEPVRCPWAESILRAVTFSDGKGQRKGPLRPARKIRQLKRKYRKRQRSSRSRSYPRSNLSPFRPYSNRKWCQGSRNPGHHVLPSWARGVIGTNTCRT